MMFSPSSQQFVIYFQRKQFVLAKCPIDPELARLSDAGLIETYGGQYLEGAADACEKLLKK